MSNNAAVGVLRHLGESKMSMINEGCLSRTSIEEILNIVYQEIASHLQVRHSSIGRADTDEDTALLYLHSRVLEK